MRHALLARLFILVYCTIDTMASNQMARRSSAMGPSVRYLLSQYQLDPGKITASGPHHTLLKGDVMEHITQNKLQPGSYNQVTSTNQAKTKPKNFTTNLDITGHQPKPGPEGFSKIAKRLLDM